MLKWGKLYNMDIWDPIRKKKFSGGLISIAKKMRGARSIYHWLNLFPFKILLSLIIKWWCIMGRVRGMLLVVLGDQRLINIKNHIMHFKGG